MVLKGKMLCVIVVSLAAMLTAGCVSTGTYQAKEQETQLLKKSLEDTESGLSELKDRNKKLSNDYELALSKLKVIESEMSELRIENEKLTNAVKPENLLKTLVDSYNSVQAENLKLKQTLSAIEKSTKKEIEAPVKLDPITSKTSKGAEKVVPTAEDPAKKESSEVKGKDSSDTPVELKLKEDKQPLEKL